MTITVSATRLGLKVCGGSRVYSGGPTDTFSSYAVVPQTEYGHVSSSLG